MGLGSVVIGKEVAVTPFSQYSGMFDHLVVVVGSGWGVGYCFSLFLSVL